MDQLPVPQVSAIAEKLWWRPLRHAYGIADVVNNENALLLIEELAISGAHQEFAGNQDAMNFPVLTVSLVLDLGEEGRLDVIVQDPDKFDVDAIWRHGAARWEGRGELQALAGRYGPAIITTVTDHVRNSPEDRTT